MWGWDNWTWGGWLVMTLTMVAFGALFAWLVLSVVRPGRPRDDRRAAPEEILAARFARGEIDEDEYRQRLEALRETRRTSAGPGRG